MSALHAVVGFTFESSQAEQIALQHLSRGQHHPIYVAGTTTQVGHLTALSYSPRFKKTLGLGFIAADVPVGTSVSAVLSFDMEFKATVSSLPFKDIDGSPVGRSEKKVST